jgi:sn-glycerol 3-phosphate transport system substrate-binding protein
MSKKLTKTDARGNVMQWGVKIPSTGFQYWMLGGLAATNGATLANADGTVTSFDDPAVVEALQYWVDLSAKHKVMPAGVVEWGTTPKDFLEKKAAIIWTTTGNLTNIRTNAQFPFGVAMLPANKRLGSPTGGGNLYFFKNSSPEQLQAAVKFAKFLTEPKRAGAWSVATGYVAVSPAAWETPEMKKYANAARRGRAVHSRRPARHQGAERRHPGLSHRQQAGGGIAEGGPARGNAHPKALPIKTLCPLPLRYQGTP